MALHDVSPRSERLRRGESSCCFSHSENASAPLQKSGCPAPPRRRYSVCQAWPYPAKSRADEAARFSSRGTGQSSICCRSSACNQLG